MKQEFKPVSRYLALKRYPGAKESPHLESIRTVFKHVFSLGMRDPKHLDPNNCSQLTRSSWHWDPYRIFHVLEPLSHIFESQSILTRKLLAKLSYMLFLGYTHDRDYRDVCYSKNTTDWFFQYWPQFDRIWAYATEKIRSMEINKDERFIIRDFGCATGEETYLLAMICAECASRISQHPEDILGRIEIIGYGIVPAMLWMAEEGRFSTERVNFRDGYTFLDFPPAEEFMPKYLLLKDGAKPHIKEICFKDKKALMHPSIFGMVKFSWINLLINELMDPLSQVWEKADIVLCRRTLYFDKLEKNSIAGGAMDEGLNPHRIAAAWNALTYVAKMVKPGGLLVIDRTEPNDTAQTTLGKSGLHALDIDEDPYELSCDHDLSGVYSKS